MTNDKTAPINASDAESLRALERRIAILEAEAPAEEPFEPEWKDFEEEEPDDRDDVKVLEKMERALPEGHVLLWALDADGVLMTTSAAGVDDDDDDQDDDG